jgi:hypothetical protein|tara:strand:+ start:322 stop:549 length:228 start_codon:yes stop_codon:yes gene_type:complete
VYLVKEKAMQAVEIGSIRLSILLAKEYAPNSSAPNPLAINVVVRIKKNIVKTDVIVVNNISLKKGLNLNLITIYH